LRVISLLGFRKIDERRVDGMKKTTETIKEQMEQPEQKQTKKPKDKPVKRQRGVRR